MSAAIPVARFVFAANFAVLGLLASLGETAAQGAPTVRVIEEPVVMQPAPFATRGETVVVPRTRIEIDEGKRGKSGVRTLELPAPGQPAPVEQGNASVAPPQPVEVGTGSGSKIISGDALGRRQKREADNTGGED